MVSDNWLSFPVVVVSIKLFKLAYLLVLHRIWSWTIGTVTYLCYTWRTTAGPCNETGFSSNANPVGASCNYLQICLFCLFPLHSVRLGEKYFKN